MAQAVSSRLIREGSALFTNVEGALVRIAFEEVVHRMVLGNLEVGLTSRVLT